MLIQADQETHAPEQTEGGLYTAKSLTSAVEGGDAAPSWFVGTVVQVGPLVNTVDVRGRALALLSTLKAQGTRLFDGGTDAVWDRLWVQILAIPRECPDPIRVGERVVFSWAAGQQVTIDGRAFVIVRADDVLARLEE